jgi:hypothetical protein
MPAPRKSQTGWQHSTNPKHLDPSPPGYRWAFFIPMPKQKTPKPFRLPERTINQLAELVAGGYSTNETAAVTEAVNYLYYHKVESANAVTLASRKIADRELSPEIVDIDGELWLNLGSGLLAEAAAAMLLQQFPGEVRTQANGMDEQMVWHRTASQDAYAMLKVIVMFRF